MSAEKEEEEEEEDIRDLRRRRDVFQIHLLCECTTSASWKVGMREMSWKVGSWDLDL